MSVHIVRGPSGCGKTTFAERLARVIDSDPSGGHSPAIISADDFFTDNEGDYHFDPGLLSRAHTECFSNVMREMFTGRDVIVANTFTNFWEYIPYVWIAHIAKMSSVIYEPDILHDLPLYTESLFKDREKGDEDWVEYFSTSDWFQRLVSRGIHEVPESNIRGHVVWFHFAETGGFIPRVEIYKTGLL